MSALATSYLFEPLEFQARISEALLKADITYLTCNSRDPKWSAAAVSLLERLDAARSEGGGPDWSTSSLRNMIARAAQSSRG